jgi:hypothetical protein
MGDRLLGLRTIVALWGLQEMLLCYTAFSSYVGLMIVVGKQYMIGYILALWIFASLQSFAHSSYEIIHSFTTIPNQNVRDISATAHTLHFCTPLIVESKGGPAVVGEANAKVVDHIGC